MTTTNRAPEDLLREIDDLRARLGEAEDTLRAIGGGEVDAFVVSGPDGEQVFTLKGAEHPYRVLVETMNEGAATLSDEGVILFANNRLADLLQTSLEKLVGSRLCSFLSPADLPLFTARLGNWTKGSAKDELALVTAAGGTVPVLMSCCSLELSGRRGVSVVVSDLSQQKRTEEVINSERLARSIIEQAGEAILVCDEEGRITRASRLAQELCGENPLLQPFNEIFKLQLPDLDCFFSAQLPLQGESFESVEVVFAREEQQLRHLILNARPLKNPKGHILGCVVTLTDITARKRAEEDLLESEARLQQVNGELQHANLDLKKAYDELQFKGEEIQMQSEELQEQSRELQEQNRELARLWDVSSRAEAALKDLNEELENRVTLRTAELAANVESLKLEVIERERAEQALSEESAQRLRAVESLREKEQMLIQQSRLAAMGEMINNIAHQWRQPLNSLGLTVQQLQMYYEYQELTQEIMQSSVKTSMTLIQHMSQTIDDFRNYFKPEQTMAEFRVSKIISSTMAIIEGSFRHDNVAVEVTDSCDPIIYGYRNEFAQSILNILNNAKDALTERKVSNPRVCIAVSRESDKTVVTIADNAGGVPEEILPRIFEPYFTTKAPQKGTGLGLYMTKNIIETKMGGRLSVRNTGEGAEFRIEV
jgi:PAS domain S-box-containing protein